ncbi:MAG: tRNA glutamyl-Q(34) synthetase GluQRS [Zetaproteobacteria bacterium]|nr:MAG: tRNA glutamyl-Q(34) synthetase GluQRS [Zetaproteobacteria bacterium]
MKHRQLRTRFAPSPTGYLHVGNAYSALICQQWAQRHDAELLLRIEDIDHTRCRPHFIAAMLEDLRWLGIRWQGEPLFQHERQDIYESAINVLREKDVIYPCFCSRRDVEREIRRTASAPHGQPASAYPGTCRHLSPRERKHLMQIRPHAWRLDSTRLRALLPEGLCWLDEHGRRHAANIDHDLVIGRKDIVFSYHLAVVMDDALQGITHVIRGEDLRASTGLHRILQYLLDLPSPVYLHHPLIRDTNGQRLAKRHGAAELRQLRQAGVDAQSLKHFLLKESGGIWPFDSLDEACRHLASASACSSVPRHEKSC